MYITMNNTYLITLAIFIILLIILLVAISVLKNDRDIEGLEKRIK